MNSTTQTYNIPAAKLPRVQSALDALNKRCRRLHIPEITLKVTGTETKMVDMPDFKELQPVPYVTVDVTGGAPKLNGWEFAATFEHVAESGLTIFRKADSFTGDIPKTYRTAKPCCDHCHLARQRKDTFLVHSASEGFKQIGRNCLRDFLGHADPHAIASAAEIWCDIGEVFSSEDDGFEWGGSGGGQIVLGLESFLAFAFGTVRAKGFLGRSKAKEMAQAGEHREATADRILRLLFPVRAMTPSQRREYEKERAECEPTEKDSAKAQAALAWVRGWEKDLDSLNDYRFNLYAACSSEIMPVRRAGIVASLPAAYEKEMEHVERVRKARENRAPSQFIGEIGKRMKGLRVKVEKVIAHEGDFGTTYIHKMTDQNGNALVWFASNGGFSEGEEYTIDATVKAHETSEKWGNQTVLTRCKATARHGEVKLPDGAIKLGVAGNFTIYYRCAHDQSFCLWDNVENMLSQGYGLTTVEKLKAFLPKKAKIEWLPGAIGRDYAEQSESFNPQNVGTDSASVAEHCRSYVESANRIAKEFQITREELERAPLGVVREIPQPNGTVRQLVHSVGSFTVYTFTPVQLAPAKFDAHHVERRDSREGDSYGFAAEQMLEETLL